MEQYRRIQSCKVRTRTHFLITDNRKFVTDGCDLLIMDLTVIQKLDDQVITRLWRIQFEQFADQILALKNCFAISLSRSNSSKIAGSSSLLSSIWIRNLLFSINSQLAFL